MEPRSGRTLCPEGDQSAGPLGSLPANHIATINPTSASTAMMNVGPGARRQNPIIATTHVIGMAAKDRRRRTDFPAGWLMAEA